MADEMGCAVSIHLYLLVYNDGKVKVVEGRIKPIHAYIRQQGLTVLVLSFSLSHFSERHKWEI